MNKETSANSNPSACGNCCKWGMICRGVVALSLALLALCALVRTFGHGYRGHHRGPWGHECGQWGHGGRMSGCGMKSRMMMGCPSKDMDDDMNEDELPARRGPEPRPDKKYPPTASATLRK